MWELDCEESWAPKNWCFWTVVQTVVFELWRRLLRVPWTARRSNQSILKEISPGCSLEGLMLKLKLQYFDHLMRRVDSLENTLMLGGIGAGGEGDNRGWDGWMASPTRWTWVWVNSRGWWWTGRPGVLRFMWLQRVGRSRDWTELIHKRNKLTQTENKLKLTKGERDGGGTKGYGINRYTVTRIYWYITGNNIQYLVTIYNRK